MSLTDEQIVAIRDRHLPSQSEPFDCIAFARAILSAAAMATMGVRPMVFDPEHHPDDALWHAAEHGLSWMIGRDYRDISDDNPNGTPVGPPKFHHRCAGCEAALKLLQARGIYTDVVVPEETGAWVHGPSQE